MTLLTSLLALLIIVSVIAIMLLDRSKKNVTKASFEQNDKLNCDGILHNRQSFIQALNQIITYNPPQLTLFTLDIDDFKGVNEISNNQTGDKLLTQIVERLQHSAPKGMTIARTNGDEFMLLDNQQRSVEEIHDLSKKLLNVINQPFYCRNHYFQITCCLGIASYPDDAHSTDELMRHSNFALNQAKKSGKNNYKLFSIESNMLNRKRIILHEHLYHTLERNELMLHYQPILTCDAQQIFACEALLRWQHQQYGNISPLEFIPILEASDLIHKIGHWIFNRVCEDLAALQNKKELKIFINLSVRQFANKKFMQELAWILKKNHTAAPSLVFEITESALLADDIALLTSLKKIRELGIGIAIDDFGTGYSSLSRVKKLPLDYLKIDKSFIRDICLTKQSQVITQTIVSMANALNLKVIAEGIERRNQLQTMLEMGCDYAQGFLLHRPTPIKELQPYLQQHG